MHIQNQQYCKKAPTPSLGDLVKLSKQERETIQQAQLVSVKDKHEKRNIFHGYTSPVTSIDEVRVLYKHLKLKHPDTTHVVAAHVLDDPRSEMKDYSDDGERGAGRRIVEHLMVNREKNVVVFIVCYHSAQNLGARRFKLILEITDELIEMLKNPSNFTVSKAKAPTRTQSNRARRV